MKRTMHRGGFTIVEVLVVGGLMALLGGLFVGARTMASETSRRVQCASHLRMLGQACLLYANENQGYLPRTRHDAAVEKWPAYTNYKATDPFTDDGPEVNDVSAPLFLLLRTQDITSEVFICPSSRDVRWDFEGKTAQDFSNFPNKTHLSYSYANPYMKQEENPLTNSLNAQYAVAGDINPGGEALTKLNPNAPAAEMRTGNSPNHRGDGQNTLYGDGHVEFNANPFVGVDRDNIYTYGASGLDSGGEGIIGASIGANDSVLLPTATQEPPAAEAN